MENGVESDGRLPIAVWLREHFPRVQSTIVPCAQRAARIANSAGASRLLEPDDFLLNAIARILERAPSLYPAPVSFVACCKIVCSFMLSDASNERRKLERRRRLGQNHD